MTCGPDEFRQTGRPNLAVQGAQTEHCESSQSSLVERVCAFLERYTIAHGDDAKFPKAAGTMSGGNPENG
jgi:hypothetical protein